ncbi:hypothetical protein BH23VER1_BH23VER1_01090 [soil metagenome]
MRAVALSNDTVISLLNGHFVPVYVSNDHYDETGNAPAEEKQAMEKIHLAAANKGLAVGSVRGYITTPEGDPISCVDWSVEALIAELKTTIETLGTPWGKPVIEPRSQNPRPHTAPDALALQLTARPHPEHQNGSGFWHELIGEDWIVYSREEWTKFLPADGAAPGSTWDVDPAVATKLLSHFYPTVEDFGHATNEIKAMSMDATLVSEDRIRLDVSLKMGLYTYPHPGGKPDELPTAVEATAVGVVDFDPASMTVERFVMATENATMNRGHFAVAVQSVPPPTGEREQ